MNKQPDKAPLKTLRDAYKVPGFHVRAQFDSYEFEHPAIVLTLDRRSKKTVVHVMAADSEIRGYDNTLQKMLVAVSDVGFCRQMSGNDVHESTA